MSKGTARGAVLRSYKAGWPFWRFMAKAGIPIRVTVEVIFDKEAKVFVAHNSNLRGLVAEAETLDELFRNLDAAAFDLLESYLHQTPTRHPLMSPIFETPIPA